MNKFISIGRLTKDPEVKTTTTGIEVATFSIAINREYKHKKGEYETDFFNCVAYRNTAKFIGQYGFKGQLINLEGRVQNRSYEHEGQRRYITEIIVDRFRMLEFKKDKKDESQKQDEFFDNNVDVSEDDLPF